MTANPEHGTTPRRRHALQRRGRSGLAREEAAVSKLTIVAQDTAFDPEVLTDETGASVRLTLVNHDPIPHSFALYRTAAAEEAVFVGETFSGPDASRTYEFTAPAEAGEYFFRCDFHPQLMTGMLIVE